ncbi:MAG TPA: tRNA uridine-5-carboxymethylaminomethyl(34) synthesis GTPase MnmE [Hyphomicrobiaceae bacterium]|nr:tRNA uridine-5-carboxymethylaminomethyl(34) synthesis GTPase MnmE [Hyphomicrobiaceae bacterium]
MTDTMQPTIFALSSAPGRAGVAIVRVSGPEAGTVLNVMAPSRPKPRMAAGRAIRHPTTGETLDRGIVIWFPAPKSFTGEDVAELQLHGGRAVVKAVLEALGHVPGSRLAEPGEFARRAFENGKIDLAEAEGLADLIDAETEAQRRQALRQASGELSGLYEGWRSALIDAIALTEAAIDFSDEADVERTTFDQAREVVAALEPAVRRHLDDGHRGEIVREGFHVALIGPPNVGKSSLLNALARRDAAIVSEEAGTTRDVIEVRLDLDGLPIVLSDTAGIRETAARIEQEGIRRTLRTAEQADLIIWLMDAHEPHAALPDELRDYADRTLSVLNKVDLLPGGSPPTLPDDMIAISATTGEGLANLTRRLAAIAAERIGSHEDWAITQVRHRRLIEATAESLEAFLGGDARQIELRAEDLRRAADALGRITGRVDVEDVLDHVFKRFCIGK